MKILVVCQHYKPEPFRLGDICETLAQQGHQVTVVTGVPNYPEGKIYPGYEHAWGKETLESGVRVRRCFTIPRKTGWLNRVINYYSFAASSTWYLSRLKEEYDVVLVHQLSPVIMAEGALRYGRKHGKKVVLYCLDLWPESLLAGGISRNSLIYKLFYHISRRIYRSVDRILITSRGFADYINNYLRVPGECVYLPQYAESLYDGVAEKPRHDGPFHLVFAGNIGEMQSVETIIGAARLLKDDNRVIFDIVGDGSALNACRRLAADLSNVVFHGRIEVEKIPQIYHMADAMLISLRDTPCIAATIPGKVQSCMAAGKPLVGSIGGETERLIRDARCGICAQPENSEALAEAIRQLLADPDRLEEYGRNARSYYQQHFRKETFLEGLMAELQAASR